MTSQPQTPLPLAGAMPLLTLLQILGLTAAGAVLGVAGVDLGVNNATAIALYAVFAAMGIVEPVIVRFVVIPIMRRQGGEAARANIVTLGFSAAAAGGFYALFAGLAEGRGWPALPIGAIALYTWVFVWMYTRDMAAVGTPPQLDAPGAGLGPHEPPGPDDL